MIFEKLIRIPNDRIAVLIGKSGNVKSKIEKSCYVELDIDGQTGDVLIQSKGDVEKIQPFKAVENCYCYSKRFFSRKCDDFVKRRKYLTCDRHKRIYRKI